MTSLDAVLKEAGVMGKFTKVMRELDLSEPEIKHLQIAIADLVLNALVQSGKTVVDDVERF